MSLLVGLSMLRSAFILKYVLTRHTRLADSGFLSAI